MKNNLFGKIEGEVPMILMHGFEQYPVFTNVKLLKYYDGTYHRWVKQEPGRLVLEHDAREVLAAERARTQMLYERLKWLYESKQTDLDETEVSQGADKATWNLGAWIKEALVNCEEGRA